jgi:hypothetical protein
MAAVRRIAVMQPYLLPYIGYFQLMAAVDCFVLLDDVNYIQRGWINRNRILLDGRAHRFTMPLRGASQNRQICEIKRVDDAGWAERLLRTLHQAYARAPQYGQVAPLLERVLRHPVLHLGDYLHQGLEAVHAYLGLRCELVRSTRAYGQESADVYINAIGGLALYEQDAFAAAGIDLRFLQSRPTHYAQLGAEHVPWLSIIDVMMFNSSEAVRGLLSEVDLLSGDNASLT